MKLIVLYALFILILVLLRLLAVTNSEKNNIEMHKVLFQVCGHSGGTVTATGQTWAFKCNQKVSE